MKAVLISTYELGRQPFGVASPAAWLRNAGLGVDCLDLSQEKMRHDVIGSADLVGIYLPMHTATRIALNIIPKLRELNCKAHLCAYGLYAALNAELLTTMGVQTILGGEFEEELVNLVFELQKNESLISVQNAPNVSLRRQKFLVPDRSRLPSLTKYAHLHMPDGSKRIVGYTEATRGCKHLCRHCPIVPVYQGNFRVIQRDVVLEDIRQQVENGAEHITFGDPDFFNGIRHAVEIVRELHHRFPVLTYDVVIKIEHILNHAEHLKTLKDTGCAFITSAVESIDDRVLEIFEKNHTKADFIEAVRITQEVGLVLVPTFVAFTPWITLEGYAELLSTLSDLQLIENVPPVQLAIRLLITSGSRLLERQEVQQLVLPFDKQALVYPWLHPDLRVDSLQIEIEKLVQDSSKIGRTRHTIFQQVWELVNRALGKSEVALPDSFAYPSRETIPYLTEPWYC